MSHIPARPLTPDELKTLKREKGLQRLTDAVEAEHAQRAQAPAKWFGRLLAVFVVAVFLDLTGWFAAFIDGKFYAIFALTLQCVETLCIIGIAGLAIYGSIESYKLQQELKRVREDFEDRQDQQG